MYGIHEGILTDVHVWHEAWQEKLWNQIHDGYTKREIAAIIALDRVFLDLAMRLKNLSECKILNADSIYYGSTGYLVIYQVREKVPVHCWLCIPGIAVVDPVACGDW